MMLPNSVRAFLRFLNLALLGAFVGALGRSMYGLYKLQIAEQPIASVPIDVLVFQVFEAHLYAAYGAIIVIVWWIGERIFRVVFRGARDFGTVFFGKTPEISNSLDPDTRIKMARRARADAYLENTLAAKNQLRETSMEPIFENRITAKGGNLNYKVFAFRYLTEGELKKVIWAALQDGTIVEPAPGETTYVTLSRELETKYLGD